MLAQRNTQYLSNPTRTQLTISIDKVRISKFRRRYNSNQVNFRNARYRETTYTYTFLPETHF